MAENKKSFVLYSDYIGMVKELTDDEAGMLFKHILAYVNDTNPECENRLVNIAFAPIKAQLKRDLSNWQSIREKRVLAGSMGGTNKAAKQNVANVANAKSAKQNVANVANAKSAKQNVANVAVTVTDTVNVNVTDNVIENTGLSSCVPEIQNPDYKPVLEKKNFAPPEIDDVVKVMEEKLDDFTAMAQAQLFLNHYESNGWKVGKNKMQNWKAAAAGWISRMKQYENGKQKLGTSAARMEALRNW
jgi:hypothetical protein